MTASRAAPAPTHRPSARAVVLAILGVALLGMLVVGAMQYATPQGDEARGVLALPAVGATLIVVDGNEVWLTRTSAGAVHAIDNRRIPGGLRYVPPTALPPAWARCFTDGVLEATASPGYPFFTLEGDRWSALTSPLYVYPVSVIDGRVRVDMGSGGWAESRALQFGPDGLRSPDDCVH